MLSLLSAKSIKKKKEKMLNRMKVEKKMIASASEEKVKWQRIRVIESSLKEDKWVLPKLAEPQISPSILNYLSQRRLQVKLLRQQTTMQK